MSKPLQSAALTLLFACSATQAQESRRQRADAGSRTSAAAPVVFLDSTRERDGLRGPVRRVETEVLQVELKGGTLLEKSRSVLERTLYDERGRRAENETYPVVSNPAGQEVHSYDAQGNLAETVVRDARGATLSRTVYRYEFDAYGNWVKMTAALAVVSAGKIAYEPVEITNRSITYYATDKSADAQASNLAGDAGTSSRAVTNKKGEDARRGATRAGDNGARAGVDAASFAGAAAGAATHTGNAAPYARGDAARAAGEAKREGARVAHANAREVEVGVLNDRATSLPHPAFPVMGRRLARPVTVSVEVLVDQTGLVVEAKAQDAPKALRQAAEDAARRATFFPFYFEGRPVRARGWLNFGFYFSP